MTNKKYGWVPDRPDQRDHMFEMLAAPKPLPTTADLRDKMPPVYNQGDLGSCTANAIAAAFDYERGKQGLQFMFPSRLFVYYNERTMEGTVNEDAGAMIRDGIKSVVRQGVCAEAMWNYAPDYFAIAPPEKCYEEALKNQALSYRRVPASLRAMLYCIAYGYPVVFGFSVYESFESEEVAKTGVVPMPTMTEQLVGGHAVLAVGFDRDKRMFLVRNSWGEDWGDGGHFWMPFDYATNPDLADDRWSIRLVETGE